jgi:prepilin-type N-terminal cleavage/methylation domain-containing protein
VTLQSQRGVTLLEMLIVVAIIGTVASIGFPALTSGLAGVRLSSASSDVASFLNSTMNTVERREQAAAIVISPKENRIDVFTAASDTKPARTYRPPNGIAFDGALDVDEPRRYMLFPGGAFPLISIVLHNEKGSRRSIKIDPVTAVPLVTRIEDAPK